MDQFTLYCMLFRALDAVWDRTRERELGMFLSGANPYLFEDEGSAVPSVYRQFCTAVAAGVPRENSYREAGRYIASLNNAAVSDAFREIGEAKWNEYLAECPDA